MPSRMKKLELSADRPPYERQPGEPDKAWNAFVLYRDLEGKRTLVEASKLYKQKYKVKGGKPLEQQFGQFSSKYLWRKRVEEWDRILDRRLREQRIHARAEMQRRHIELARSLQGIGALGARQLYAELKNRVAGGAIVLTAKELVALMDSGTKLERLNLGEPDSIQENRHVFDVEKERRTLQKLVENPDLMDALDEALGDDEDAQD